MCERRLSLSRLMFYVGVVPTCVLVRARWGGVAGVGISCFVSVDFNTEDAVELG